MQPHISSTLSHSMDGREDGMSHLSNEFTRPVGVLNDSLQKHYDSSTFEGGSIGVTARDSYLDRPSCCYIEQETSCDETCNV
jgi:hypothetical protein